MRSRQFNVRFLAASAALAATVWSIGACAQESDKSLEAAGSEAKFRVISRFPAEQAAEVPMLGGERAFVDEAVRDAITAEKFDVARLLLAQSRDKSPDNSPDNSPDKQAGADDPYLDLLDGYLAFAAGEHDEALETLDALANKVPELDDYRLYWAARSADAAEKHHEATLRAAQVPKESLLFGRSLMLLAESLLAADTDDDTERAINTYELYLAQYPNGRSSREARIGLAQALEKAEHWEDAAKAYLAVVEKDALGASATLAHQRLQAIKDKLSDELKAAVDEPSTAARMNRYRALFASHRSETVIAEVAEEIEGLEDDKKNRCEALYLVARSYTKLRRHSDGSKWYERVLDECGDTGWALKALYMGGKGYWNSGEPDEAKKLFARIWTNYAEHSFADDAMYFSARILREQEKKGEARKLLEEQVATYPTGDMAKDAHWLLVRDFFASKKYADVVAYVDGLSQTGEDDLYSRGRLHYFRARALQELGQDDEAAAGYRAVAKKEPLSYYAYLAFSRLGQMAEVGKKGGRAGVSDLCALGGGSLCDFVEPKRSEKIALSQELRDAAHFKRGAQLLRLGLTDLAEDEFQALRRSKASEANLWALTYLLDQARAHRISHDMPRRHIRGWKTHYPQAGDDPRWTLAFPTPFEQLVGKFVAQRKLPKALVYAIMREESGFNPRIESWANARGLLQLMEATAENVAREDGLAGFAAEKLFEPATNIRLGTGYIAELGEQLDAHPALIIAGYNGGHANVARWLKARGDLPLDLWVEDIPYGQTRKYTKRVLASFWTYSWMYGDDRVPRLSFELPTE